MLHEDIVKKLTLEEKAAMCSGLDYWHTVGAENLGCPSIMLTDGPNGIRKRSKEKTTKEERTSLKGVPAICYPTASATAASWNPDLIEEMGKQLGKECLKEEISVILGPGINMKRSPLGGRNFEYFSEDPYLAGEIAAAFINGVQSQGIGTSLKHFCANSQEARRMTINEVVDERTLREIYLTAFEIAVKKSQPWTIMNSYNRLNGTYMSENRRLLTDVLRTEWGYEGIVVTDWGAENDIVEGIKAGQNLEMPTSNGLGAEKLIKAVQEGRLDEKVLDESVDQIIELEMKAKKVLGQKYSYDMKEHHDFARKIAEECIVLLKNEENILPLNKEQSIAVIGEMAEIPRYQGAGSSEVNARIIDSGLASITAIAKKVSYAKGYKSKKAVPNEKLISEAVEIAKSADVAVVFIGLTDNFESEGFDRNTLKIPESHIKLLERVSAVNQNVVVVISGGAPIEMPWISNCKALVNGYLTGEATGAAIANVLYGIVNPSGKLAETYPISLEDTPTAGDFPSNSRVIAAHKESVYIGYRYYDTAKKDVLFPFGFGLSYTNFEYSDIKLSKNSVKDSETVTVSFKIKNTGKVDGAEIAELYVKDDESTIFRPEKELRAFKKVFLKAGEEAEIKLELSKRAFAFWNTNSNDWCVEGGSFSILVGASSRDIRLEAKLNVIPEKEELVMDYRQTAPTYYTADVKNITDKQFEEILGEKLPSKVRDKSIPLGLTNTIEDGDESQAGKKLEKIIRNSLKKFAPEQADFFAGVVLGTPIKNFISMSFGIFDDKMAANLLDALNGKKKFGKMAWKMVGAIPHIIKNIGKLKSI